MGDRGAGRHPGPGVIQLISAVTLHVTDMARSTAFYEALGFVRRYGGPDAGFTSYTVGSGWCNLQLADSVPPPGSWGRVIFWVDDVDALHRRATAAGLRPEAEPADAPWGERYFHLRDPDGHELSFARPLTDGEG